MIAFVKRNDKPNKKGLYAVRLRITKERQRKYIGLKIYTDNESWDAESERFYILRRVNGERQKAENDLRKRYNYALDQYRVQARDIIDNFRRERVDWTLNQFEDAFLNKSKQGKLKSFLENHIKNLRETGHIGNANCYSDLCRLLTKYDSKFDRRIFSEFDIKYVNELDTVYYT